MFLKVLDVFRHLGWKLIDFIYNLIDSLFDILKEINALDVVNSISSESMFNKFYKGMFTIAVSVLGLFAIWNFIKKVIDPDDSPSSENIIKEIIKCGILVFLSTFMFIQSSSFSIKLSGYTSNISTTKNTTLADNILVQYVNYSKGYEEADLLIKNFDTDIDVLIKNDTFTNKEMYNDKYVTSHRWILPDKKAYKYDINWIMAIIVGAFFLYALFFSGMMLARRQIEFLFLFCISPVIFATSVGNKQRRSAVFEQLVSLILQGAVVMMIIGLTVLLMKSIQSTTFFTNSTKDMVIKSILYIGCGTFLLTGSQVVNRFIGGNVSANSGREHLMSMMGFGQGMKTGALSVGAAGVGAGLVSLGVGSSITGKLGGNKLINKVGNSIANFGKNISESHSSGSRMDKLGNKVGNHIAKFGTKVLTKTPSHIGKTMRRTGYNKFRNSASRIAPVIPIRNRRG